MSDFSSLSTEADKLYDRGFEGARQAGGSPYREARDWAKKYEFLKGKYVYPKDNPGRTTDFRNAQDHIEVADRISDRMERGSLYVESEDYGILLRPENRVWKSLKNMFSSPLKREYRVADIFGLDNLSRNYGDLVDDPEFETVANDLNEFTDIDDFLDSRDVYVKGVNAENHGSENLRYRKPTEGVSKEEFLEERD